MRVFTTTIFLAIVSLGAAQPKPIRTIVIKEDPKFAFVAPSSLSSIEFMEKSTAVKDGQAQPSYFDMACMSRDRFNYHIAFLAITSITGALVLLFTAGAMMLCFLKRRYQIKITPRNIGNRSHIPLIQVSEKNLGTENVNYNPL